MTNPIGKVERMDLLRDDPVGYVVQQMDFILASPVNHADSTEEALRLMLQRWRGLLAKSSTHAKMMERARRTGRKTVLSKRSEKAAKAKPFLGAL